MIVHSHIVNKPVHITSGNRFYIRTSAWAMVVHTFDCCGVCTTQLMRITYCYLCNVVAEVSPVSSCCKTRTRVSWKYMLQAGRMRLTLPQEPLRMGTHCTILHF